MKTIKNGCSICFNDVTGDAKHKYYCKHCNILYDESQVREHNVEVENVEVEKELELNNSENNIEFLNNKKGKIALTSVKREKGFLYFIDKKGDVSRVKMARSRADKGPKLHEKILVVGLKKEKNFLYYLDKDGDIARSPMKRR